VRATPEAPVAPGQRGGERAVEGGTAPASRNYS
jgi:hypothetical protein